MKWLTVLAAFTMSAALAVGAAHAADASLWACLKKGGTQVRLVDELAECSPAEVKVEWIVRDADDILLLPDDDRTFMALATGSTNQLTCTVIDPDTEERIPFSVRRNQDLLTGADCTAPSVLHSYYVWAYGIIATCYYNGAFPHPLLEIGCVIGSHQNGAP